MIELNASVLGVEAVALRLEKAAAGARVVVRQRVQGLGLELLRKVREEYLTGQALRVQTGRLRRSINEQTEDTGAGITSTVGTAVVYGGFWERGFTGTQQVREFVRTAQSGIRSVVRAHQRRVDQAPRPFLQPALAAMRSRIHDRLSDAGLVP